MMRSAWLLVFAFASLWLSGVASALTCDCSAALASPSCTGNNHCEPVAGECKVNAYNALGNFFGQLTCVTLPDPPDNPCEDPESIECQNYCDASPLPPECPTDDPPYCDDHAFDFYCENPPEHCPGHADQPGCEVYCATHDCAPIDPEPDPCTENPDAPGCDDRPWCALHPDDPACEAPEPFCKLHPTDPACVDPPPYCMLHPEEPACSSPPPWCELNPDSPWCAVAQPPPWCALNPSDPACNPIEQPPPWCHENPDDPACQNPNDDPPWCAEHPDDPACINTANSPDYCGEHPGDASCAVNRPGTLEYCAAHPMDAACMPSRAFCEANPMDRYCIRDTCAANPSLPGCPNPGGDVCNPGDPGCTDPPDEGEDFCETHPDSLVCQSPSAGSGSGCASAPPCSGDPVGCASVNLQWQLKCGAEERFNDREAMPSGDCEVAPACSGDPIDCAMLTQLFQDQCNATGHVAGGDTCDAPPECTGDELMCGVIRLQWQVWCESTDDFDPGDPGNEEPDISGLTPGAMTVDGGDLTAGLDDTGFLGGGSCPQFPTIQALNAVLDFNTPTFCTLMQFFAALVLATAYFKAARIILGP